MGRRADFSHLYFRKILEQTKAGLWVPRSYDGHSQAPLDCLRLAAIVRDAVFSRQQRWSGTRRRERPLGRRRFFHRFCAHFCVTLEHLFLKRQKSAEKSAHWAPKKSAQKSAHKNLRKNLRKKSAQKSAPKSAHQNQRKNCTKNRCEYSVSLEDESHKKKPKRSAPNLCKTPAPKNPNRWRFWFSFLGFRRLDPNWVEAYPCQP